MGLLDIPWLTESLKKRGLRYLIQRYMGHFLSEKLTLEQLSIELFDGKGCIKDLTLDVDGLNEELVFLPFRFSDGCRIDNITCFVPWSSLMSESCSLEIHGASFYSYLIPTDSGEQVELFESSYLTKSMMSSSMQMAEDIAQEEHLNNDAQQFEGLEMMAQLIDSVLRRVKLTAIDTRFVMQKGPTSSSTDRVEFKIRSLRCEEDFIQEDAKDFKTTNPGNIDKQLTLEGIEIAINGRTVSRIGGQHIIKIKASHAKSDIQIYLGSPLLAVVNSSELRSFFQVLIPPECDPNRGKPVNGTAMSTMDFKYIEIQLMADAARGCSSGYPRSYTHSSGMGSNLLQSNDHWASATDGFNHEPKFHPMSGILDEDEEDNPRNQSIDETSIGSNQFTGLIKIPGVFLCLLENEELSPPESIIPLVSLDFEKISHRLDDVLEDRNHIRFIAFPIQVDITRAAVTVIIGDAMVVEQQNERSNKIPFIWSEFSADDNLKTKVTDRPTSNPRYRVEVNKSTINIHGSETTCITLDPTFLERMDRYLPPATNGLSRRESSPTLSQSDSNPLLLEISSSILKVSLLFPIPDLRTDSDRTFSPLRNESVLLIGEDVCAKTNLKQTSLTMDSLKGILFQLNEAPFLFMEGRRNPVDPIEININSMAGSLSMDEDEAEGQGSFMGGSMMDSVYIFGHSSAELSPFLLRQKVGKENEPLTLPSDRNNSSTFLRQARENSALKFDINVPSGDITLDQDILNLVYNRFANDLAFWTPVNREAKIDPETYLTQTYKPCGTTLLQTSTDSSDSNIFHSTHESMSVKMANDMIITLNLQELNFKTIVSEENTQIIRGQKILLGVVLGLDHHTNNVIFLNGDNVNFYDGKTELISNNNFTNCSSALNGTFEITKKDKEHKNIKIAMGLVDASLNQLLFDPFMSFYRFIRVVDEDVLGYVSPEITIELHFSISKGAIVVESEETRPALFTFDEVYITSMVLEDSVQTFLRFIFEEGAFLFSKSGKSSTNVKDYVCVMDTGLTDIKLKMKSTDKIDLKVRNNLINIRCCSDSLNAFCHLISHFAKKAQSPTEANDQTETISEGNESIHDDDEDYSEMSGGEGGYEPSSQVRLMDDAIRPYQASNVEEKGSNNSFGSNEHGSDSSEFDILGGEEEFGIGYTQSNEPQVRRLVTDRLVMNENYFSLDRARPLPPEVKETLTRFLLEELSIIFNIFGGKDFNDEEEGAAGGEKDNEKDSIIGFDHPTKKDHELRVRFSDDGNVHLWDSLNLICNSEPSGKIYGTSANLPIIINKTAGGKNRQTDVCVQIYLSKVQTLFEVFDPSFRAAWRFILLIHEIEVRDKVKDSTINKLLYEYWNETMPRRNSANMLSIRASSIKNQDDKNEECDIKVSVKPLRVNIDQDTLLFLIDFFTSINPDPDSKEQPNLMDPSPNLNVKYSPKSASNHEIVIDEKEKVPRSRSESESSGHSHCARIVESSKPPCMYIRSFIFSPDVPIRLDYCGKRMDFDKGALAGILMGLGQLNQSELKLKRLCNKNGILGLDRAILYALNEWGRDIKRTQLPNLLVGVGPVGSLYQLINGVKDLFWMPIDQYRKDKRLVRGLQRGATSFSSSTAMALIDLTNRLVNIVQNTAQFAHNVVSPPGYHHQRYLQSSLRIQPRDGREGFTKAYETIIEGINVVKNSAASRNQTGDVTETIGAYVRSIPSGILIPFIHISHASSNVLVGIRNQIDPDYRKDDQKKLKSQSVDKSH